MNYVYKMLTALREMSTQLKEKMFRLKQNIFLIFARREIFVICSARQFLGDPVHTCIERKLVSCLTCKSELV